MKHSTFEGRNAEQFLKLLKDNKITQKKMNQHFLSRPAIAFVKAVRKHGQKAYDALLKEGGVCQYSAHVVIEELLKNK